ncbi:hypothetical protein HanPSC8_Chr07g0292071 [Helianthus annuus]|nr:hypothetical protein HanPSC8_Chr07g0292071 [Helianthus annuus]
MVIDNLNQIVIKFLKRKRKLLTAVGSPIRTPRKIALVGFAFKRASKPDLKSSRMISARHN